MIEDDNSDSDTMMQGPAEELYPYDHQPMNHWLTWHFTSQHGHNIEWSTHTRTLTITYTQQPRTNWKTFLIFAYSISRPKKI